MLEFPLWIQQTWAHGNASPEETGSLWLDFNFDPSALFLFLAAWFYTRGWLRYRRQGGVLLSRWRARSFALGVALSLLALLSFVDTLADRSFLFHMIQHALLMLVAAPTILLGAPFFFIGRGAPQGIKQHLLVPLARHRLLRKLAYHATQPLPSLAVFQVTLLFWHVPAVYDLALKNELFHYLEHGTFFLAAILFWWHIVTPYPFPARAGYPFRMFTLFLSSIVNNVLAALITFSPVVLYSYTARWRGDLGLSPLEDQQLGGLLMWTMGSMWHVLAILILFGVFARQNK